MPYGSHPIASYLINNHTIAASAGGTAAATALVTSISAVHACSWSVYNLTRRNLELVIGAEAGTAAVAIFIPGNTTVAESQAMPGIHHPIALSQGMSIRARTTEDTPITCAATLPLAITLWA